MHWLLYPREETQYPPYRRLGGPWGWSRPVWKTLPPTGVRTLGHPACCKLLSRLPRSQQYFSLWYLWLNKNSDIIPSLSLPIPQIYKRFLQIQQCIMGWKPVSRTQPLHPFHVISRQLLSGEKFIQKLISYVSLMQYRTTHFHSGNVNV
jgi:hypothetical protein